MDELIPKEERETVDMLIRVMKHNLDVEKKMTELTGIKNDMFRYPLSQMQEAIFRILNLQDTGVGTYDSGVFRHVFESEVSIWDVVDFIVARNFVRDKYTRCEINRDELYEKTAELEEKYGLSD
ncbi:hypothetical protein FT641_18450 [Bacillus paranthracis]|uniref:hypothetical protein n=1 Tax=Bacillus paranthracis TaxID=2026186 RepID=UPI00187A5451|nr:hypothetical protein [Bacillus paranthracis]MBE7114455.1 hypothetical protein [Bacillus paranthracis]MBE7154671.1 hypothetical protein [Bacillus paranthracis]